SRRLARGERVSLWLCAQLSRGPRRANRLCLRALALSLHWQASGRRAARERTHTRRVPAGMSGRSIRACLSRGVRQLGVSLGMGSVRQLADALVIIEGNGLDAIEPQIAPVGSG